MYAQNTLSPTVRAHGAPAWRPAPSASQVEALALDGPTQAYSRDDEIFGEGEPADFVYQVVRGAVRTYRLLSDGRRQIEEFHHEGDCFGLELGAEHRTSAEALGDVVVRVMRRSALSDQAAGDASVARMLWSMTANTLRRTQDHVMMLGRRSAVERLAGFLLDLNERLDASGRLDLPMSRQDIADYLGLTIETVSRTFTQLQSSHLIDVLACRRIVMRDIEGLREICE